MYTDRKNTRWLPKSLAGFFVLATGLVLAVSAFGPARTDAAGLGVGVTQILAADADDERARTQTGGPVVAGVRSLEPLPYPGRPA